jgi:hypothetical protein
MRMRLLAALILSCCGASFASAAPATVVFCAPGYPGTTAEAQPSMDAFAAALGAEVGAVYHETEKGGEARIAEADAGLALVSLPFFLEHRRELRLEPRLQAVPTGTDGTEIWSLAARKGRVTRPAQLDGFEIVSLAAYAPRFVRGTALRDWGVLPESARLVESGQVLSALRRAARDETVAVLLDGAQSAAFPTLPFAADLEIVARSAPLPAAVLCTVGGHVPEARARELVAALARLHERPDGAAALEGLRLARFAPLDTARLDAATRAYAAP